MKKYILLTKSELCDNFHYFIEAEIEPTYEQLYLFLLENANDKCGDEVYENVEELIEIEDYKFLKI